MTRLWSALLVFGVALAGCASTPPEEPGTLREGVWTGALTPMNHPDQSAPVSYQVAYEGERLVLAITGPDGQTIPTREVLLTADELAFAFNESEANVLLRCALARQPDGHFDGRCSDADGKWARFTMVPPEG